MTCIEPLESRRLLSAALDGVIVFMTNRDGNYEIYSMDPYGGQLKNLTNNPATDAIPQVSDDGTMVAFSSDRGHPGQQDVYTMNIDGSNVKQVTNNPAFDWDPALSPDNQKILFMSDRSGQLNIWVANSDGSNPVNMTGDLPGGGDFASWSDYGSKIVFSSYNGNNEDIYTMNADGSNKTRLTFTPGRDTYPAFSPDGNSIAFTSERAGNRQIFLMNSDGTNQHNLSNNAFVDQVPYFNPDGDVLSFMSYRDGQGEVYEMNLDGSNQTRITNNPAQEAYPGWGERPAVAPPGPSLNINDVSVAEGDSGTRNATFTVSLSAASSQPVTVNYATADGSATAAGNDYTAVSGPLTFAPGITKQLVNVPIKGDYNIEPNETFAVNLTSPVNATIADGQGIGTIMNDDVAGTLQFSAPTYSVNENGGSATITVTRTGGSGGTVGVSFATSNGTAVAPGDYATQSGTRSWAPGDNSPKTFIVPIVDDSLVESNESINLKLTNPTGGATLGATANAVLTIVDNDVASPPPSGQKIVYQTNLTGNNEIYSMNPDGTGQMDLSNNAAVDVTPNVSADGSKIVFASDRAQSNQYDIYIMNGNGTNPVRLTSDPAVDYLPAISPDKSKIAFLSTRSGNYDIWLMNADGTGLLNLTASNSKSDAYASVGVNNKVLFSSDRDTSGNFQIYSINADGTGLTRLTNSTGYDINAVYSPDGSKIAFQSDRDGNREIYLMNADGTGVTRLTNNAAVDQNPQFSPDGSRIVFTSDRNGNAEIYSMSALDGSGVTRLTNNTAADNYPSWGGATSSALSTLKPQNRRITPAVPTAGKPVVFSTSVSPITFNALSSTTSDATAGNSSTRHPGMRNIAGTTKRRAC